MFMRKRKPKNPARRLRKRLFRPLLLAFITFECASNWYVHQPAERREAIARRLPDALVVCVNTAGNAFAEYTDNLGVTGRDVSVATPENYGGAPAGFHFLGMPPHLTTNAAAPAALVPLLKTGFITAYSPDDKHPYWVAYKVEPVASLATPPRPTRFTSDPLVKSPVHDAYTNSGYDRGHMAPNFAIASRYGAEAQKETFLTSNICPQRPDLNQGAWRDVEHRIASIYGQQYPVWVIIGALPPASPDDRFEKSGVTIPAGFYHIIMSHREGRLRVCAMLFPQDTPRHAYPRAHLVSVREIETLTGLEFFPDMPAGEREQLILPTPTRLWPAGFAGTFKIFQTRTEQRALSKTRPPKTNK